jgi:hypothetical protein
MTSRWNLKEYAAVYTKQTKIINRKTIKKKYMWRKYATEGKVKVWAIFTQNLPPLLLKIWLAGALFTAATWPIMFGHVTTTFDSIGDWIF